MSSGTDVAVVVVAAGAGSRVGAGRNKTLLALGDRPVLAHAVTTALAVPQVGPVVVVHRPGEQDEVGAALAPWLGEHQVRLVAGGDARHASEYAGLQALRAEVSSGTVAVVAVHDAARPLAGVPLFSTVIAAARDAGGAVPGVDVGPVVTQEHAPPPGRLMGMQTPQAFGAAPLLEAYDRAAAQEWSGTDTAACVARFAPGVRTVLVPGDRRNIKVTWPEDLTLAERLRDRGPRGG